jgi:putative transposase
MTQPRKVYPGQTVHLTRRTLRRTLLLRPDCQLNQLIWYVVALFAQKFSMQLCAIQVLGDHYHMVLTDVLGRLPDFVRELNRILALCIKVLRKWEGPLWEPDAVSVVELLTAEAEAEGMVYTWLNAVRAGLVRDARVWPGVTTRLDDVDGPTMTCKRPELYLDASSGRWPDTVELRFTMPPKLAALGQDEARRLLQAELERQLAEARKDVRKRGWRVLGPDRCRRVSPYQRATSWEPLRSRNPVLAAGRGMRRALREGMAALRAFRTAYRTALEHWRQGRHDVVFPFGTWWMVRFHGAAVGPPPLPLG